jgi:hypothetical protein
MEVTCIVPMVCIVMEPSSACLFGQADDDDDDDDTVMENKA